MHQSSLKLHIYSDVKPRQRPLLTCDFLLALKIVLFKKFSLGTEELAQQIKSNHCPSWGVWGEVGGDNNNNNAWYTVLLHNSTQAGDSDHPQTTASNSPP